MDDYRSVRPGDKLRVTSKAWNRVVDGLRTKPDFLARAGEYEPTNFRLLARNQTTGAVARWGVLQITGVSPAVTTGAVQFQEWPAIVGDVPATGAAPYVVAVEPIAAGAMGRVAIDGVVQVKLDVSNVDHRFAAPKAGSTARMESAPAGPAAILWKEPGTGDDKWALVRIGDGGGSTIRLGKITGPWNKGATAPVYEYTGDGVRVTGASFDATNRFATIQATGPTGAWVACGLVGSRWHLIAAECGS